MQDMVLAREHQHTFNIAAVIPWRMRNHTAMGLRRYGIAKERGGA